MRVLARVVSDRLTDWISPPSCAACRTLLRTSNAAFCAPCAASVELVTGAFVVGSMQVVAVGAFGGALADAIRHLKYDDRPDLARPLGDLLGQVCLTRPVHVDLVAPVPLHVTRLAERGYNQAALVAARVARLLRVRLRSRLLARIEMTTSQARLGKEDRLLHVAHAFTLQQRQAVQGKALLLVDDVVTTGSTLQACAAVALQSGASTVMAAVVARTPLVTSTSDPSPQGCSVRGALEIGGDLPAETGAPGRKTGVCRAPGKR